VMRAGAAFRYWWHATCAKNSSAALQPSRTNDGNRSIEIRFQRVAHGVSRSLCSSDQRNHRYRRPSPLQPWTLEVHDREYKMDLLTRLGRTGWALFVCGGLNSLRNRRDSRVWPAGFRLGFSYQPTSSKSFDQPTSVIGAALVMYLISSLRSPIRFPGSDS
jgi:hypothetical protein